MQEDHWEKEWRREEGEKRRGKEADVEGDVGKEREGRQGERERERVGTEG